MTYQGETRDAILPALWSLAVCCSVPGCRAEAAALYRPPVTPPYEPVPSCASDSGTRTCKCSVTWQFVGYNKLKKTITDKCGSSTINGLMWIFKLLKVLMLWGVHINKSAVLKSHSRQILINMHTNTPTQICDSITLTHYITLTYASLI